MKSRPPIIVEVTRGERVESIHPVDAVVMDASGKAVSEFGNSDKEIFPRSSVKALQAVLLVETGAADQFSFDNKQLALACSSHMAEKIHVHAAGQMLSQAGLEPECLECGPERPRLAADQDALARQGTKPEKVHNTCSGKHAGFLAVCNHIGFTPKGYSRITHPLQKELAGKMEQLTSSRHGRVNHGIDGCSIPTYSIPLKNFATAFARFGTGTAHEESTAKAMLRLRDACLEHPEFVAGSGQACTTIMKALGSRAFVKYGAEGVYTAAIPEKGYGITLKVRDGAPRAAEAAVAGLIARLLPLSEDERAKLQKISNAPVVDRNGVTVGELRVEIS